MKRFLAFIYLFATLSLAAQDSISVMSLDEYLGYVKAFHPIVKQANLMIAESEAKLLKSRGAFDPKFEISQDRKTFKKTEYYDKLNASFKIPTWYGIELKGNFEENDGVYLNPELGTPDKGLYSAGISVDLAKGLFANERMTTLKQSKLFVKQTQADRQLLVNNILYDAILSYLDWLKTYNEKMVYETFLTNAETRFKGLKKSYELGELPAIDTLEARITLNTRKLSLEKSKIKYTKASLVLSNYLWLKDNTPIELKDHIIPDTSTFNSIDESLNTSMLNQKKITLENHPKLLSLDYKLQYLTLEKRLKANNLLPKINFQYNFLSQTPEVLQSFNTSAYKSGLSMSFPLFLRKERAELKLAKLKLQNMVYDIKNTEVSLKNKIKAVTSEIESFALQNAYINTMVSDYKTMLDAEERKFFLGESSFFLVNSRESKLLDAKLKAIELEIDFIKTKAELFNIISPSIN